LEDLKNKKFFSFIVIYSRFLRTRFFIIFASNFFGGMVDH